MAPPKLRNVCLRLKSFVPSDIIFAMEKTKIAAKAKEETKEYGVAWIVSGCKGYMGAYHDYTPYADEACRMTKEEAEAEALKNNKAFETATACGCGSSAKTEFKAIFLPDETKNPR